MQKQRNGRKEFQMTRLLVVENPENLTLIREISNNGIDIVTIPSLMLAKARPPREAIGYVRTIIFADCASACHFLCRLEESEGDADLLLEVSVCAIGSSTVEALRDFSVHADIVPLERGAQGVASALRLYDAEETLPFLLVGGERSFRAALVDDLGGFEACASWPDGDSAWEEPAIDARLAAVVIGGGLDGIIVGTSDDLVAIEVAFGSLAALASDCVFYTEDERARRTLAEAGILTRRVSDLLTK